MVGWFGVDTGLYQTEVREVVVNEVFLRTGLGPVSLGLKGVVG